MTLTFFGPFQKMAARQVMLELAEPIDLRRLVRILAEKYPALQPYSEYETDAALGAHVVFLARGGVLKLADPVHDSDQVNVMLPMVGG